MTPALAAFQAWFGASKVVDLRGQPLVVYHGTRAEENFSAFDGGWFSDDPDMAAGYAHGAGGRVIPVYLRIERPVTAARAMDEARRIGIEPRTEAYDHWLRTTYDGIDHGSGGVRVFIPFTPCQIKSAIGNRGHYSPASADIAD